MTQQAEGSRPQITLHDLLSRLLDRSTPADKHDKLDKKALLATLHAEITSRETRAYTAGWNDALTELGRPAR
ncbi:hypothetical protein ABT024_36815 [Streptomyces sp. NPDC002812]|uniref:hypothetical protein n=1 Tax=unclassified Streptomyces TaxID=2593676 RepID=UPI00202E1453|nr:MULTISPECIES: hypothetical protein [unclassified Streptomyces]MCM1977221.1 hypothetical protein [Streptomyces sp. G1]MCX5123157.1 hypothetical protein [Streptomyces sp. NBC_00347]MCX5296503.1 hypothetical protein [Streptomyces sp. NBC_00193]